MARIRGVDTAPEVTFRNALTARGLSHSVDVNVPFGRPDIVLSAERVAIFIDGCFWHGCPLHYSKPRTRSEFWSAKLITNLERDAYVCVMLTEAEWKVIRLWEHDVIEDLDKAADAVERISRAKASPSWQSQRRVRRVVEVADHIERREYVLLGEPAVLVDAIEGPRLTAKARAKKRS